MEITKLSTKGQIVIPESIRKGLDVGSAFKIMRHGDLIVLKGIEKFSKEEMREMGELDKIWKNIDNGKNKSYTPEEFFKEMNLW